jgi:predicted cupin superfamily sugar epimerase
VTLTAEEIVSRLGLEPHPEGGWYRQTWEGPATAGGRPSGTAIYYLLAEGQRSHWHKVDAAEIWHFYAGWPLMLSISPESAGPASDITLGPDLAAGQVPQAIVPKDHWQAARPLGAWSLMGCTVSPGFRFDGFTLAPEGFDIPRG